MARLGKALMLLGLIGFVGAIGWWFLFFEQFLGADVKDASPCFYYTTDICSLGRFAGMVSDIPIYSPLALWTAAGVFAFGLILFVMAPRRS